jgi:hypothetical protein
MGMTSDEATTFAAHLPENRECGDENLARRDASTAGGQNALTPVPHSRFRLEAAQALRRLADWVGRAKMC